MPDVFIGYKREERRVAQPLAATLEAFGYTTWFDAELIPGVDFSREIERQVREAKCVIVIWSANSVNSAWVQAEASIGLELGNLIQIVIDDAQPPIRFRSHQHLRLTPDADTAAVNGDPNFPTLIEAVTAKVGRKREEIAPDQAAWALAQAIRTPEAYREFLSSYPSSRFAPEAQRRLGSDGASTQGKVFLSYRRDDTQAVARLLFERIGSKLGKENVFFDVDSIPLGETFDAYIERRLLECSSVLAIIGRTWLGKSPMGSRIKSKKDFVRKEVELALRQKTIRVIPVLVAPHPLPSVRDLPRTLRPLLGKQAADLSLGRDYDQHIERIVSAVI